MVIRAALRSHENIGRELQKVNECSYNILILFLCCEHPKWAPLQPQRLQIAEGGFAQKANSDG
jgi:hypothetical protein